MFTDKEIDIAINLPVGSGTKITTEKMALDIASLYLDFDEDLHKKIEKTIIDYYLKKGEL